PVFAQAIAECETVFSGLVDWSLTDVLRGVEGSASLDRVDVVQPALFAVMIGLARVWRSLGVEPDAVLGHSQGEIAAAHVAGALHGPGGTGAPGAADLLDDLVAECEAAGLRARRIPVDYASHSAHVERIESALRDVLADIEPRPSSVRFFSSLEGAWIEDTSTLDAAYWYRNLRDPVLFGPAVETLKSEGHLFFVEAGPHPVLLMALPEEVVGIGSLRRGEGGLDRLLLSAGEAWTNGLDINWASLYAGTGAKRV